MQESPIDIKKELSYVDAAAVNLRVFKISSRKYFNGQQLKERVKML
jgi:hypothetical protein